MRHFDLFYTLLVQLALPINQDKLCSPCKDLTCLGIRINIPEASLSIDPVKLTTIHKECHHIYGRKYLSRKQFQSLIGKLIYLQKCVIPARVFINRILDLFRRSAHKNKIYLSTEFFRDLNWFIKFCPISTAPLSTGSQASLSLKPCTLMHASWAWVAYGMTEYILHQYQWSQVLLSLLCTLRCSISLLPYGCGALSGNIQDIL